LREEQEDATAGRAILVGGRPMPAHAPAWVCLGCAPEWDAPSRLALDVAELQSAKEEAVAARDYDRAFEIRTRERSRKHELDALVETLLKCRTSEV
jgi:hypothetical protein